VRLKMEGWVIGKSKVFLKYYNEEYLARWDWPQTIMIIATKTEMLHHTPRASFMIKLSVNPAYM
jgi:myosin-3